jgi:Tol biopolymer transport system component
MDKIINSLKPGQSAQISEFNGVSVRAERSGDGKTLRFVRITADTQTVFRTVKF